MPLSTAAFIGDRNRFLLVRRPPGGDLGGKWELPGGKVDHGESPQEALKRELNEELGVTATVGEPLGTCVFHHSGRRYTLHGYRVQIDPDNPKLNEHVDLRRCNLNQALDLDLAPSDRRLLQTIFPDTADRGSL